MPLRTKSKDKQAEARYWHSDFRQVGDLPDVKVVRTAFFVNILAVALPLLLGVWTGNNEIEAAALRSEISTLEASVASARPKNQQALKLDKEFSAQLRKVNAFSDFFASSFEPLHIISIFSNSRPDGLIFDQLSVSLRKETTRKNKKSIEKLIPTIKITGELDGDSTTALAVLQDYEQQILEIEELVDRIENLEAKPQRSSDVDAFRFIISMDLPQG
ncbi:MAG: hypothetical protein ACFBZ8_10185 [Opitutales bacterium]